jgi:2-succinyl-5-enolpyruvyl-6-hydroxy-3-cyclohexene-1-carboxylate synthase
VKPTLEPWPDLRVVVADDDGGSIFHGLEQGAPEFAGSFERVFGTPQGLDLVAVASALGWTAVRVQDRGGLVKALSSDADFVVVSVPRG